MDHGERVACILRSMCVKSDSTEEERRAAIDNYTFIMDHQMGFSGTTEKVLKNIEDTYVKYSGPPEITVLRDRFAMDNDLDCRHYMDILAVTPAQSHPTFREFVGITKEIIAQRNLTKVCEEATDMAIDGISTKNGIVKGVDSAIDLLWEKTSEIKSVKSSKKVSIDNSEGTIMAAQTYKKRKESPELAFGMATGLTNLDHVTKGGQPGDLWVIGGFSSHGKSTLCLNWVRNLITVCGYNVFFYSLEMSVYNIFQSMTCAHASDLKWGRPPLEYEKIKSGSLSNEEEDFYLNSVLPDLDYNQNPQAGRLILEKPDRSVTLDDVRARAEAINRRYPLDVIIIDYISNLSPPKGFRDRRDGMNQNLIDAKKMALDFDNGHGIWCISPHQINRAGVEAASQNEGVYDFSALSDANEAERSSDVVLTIYQDSVLSQRNEAVITHLKNRDGAKLDPFNVYFPKPCRFIGDLNTPNFSSSEDNGMIA